MKTSAVACLIFIFLWCSSASADYCKTDDFDNTTSCSLMIKTGAIGDPVLIFIREKSDWQFAIWMKFDEWVRLEGDARVKIDNGEILTLNHVATQRKVMSGGAVMESPLYAPTEEFLNALAHANTEVWFRIPAEKTAPKDLKVPASKLAELSAFIAEAKTK